MASTKGIAMAAAIVGLAVAGWLWIAGDDDAAVAARAEAQTGPDDGSVSSASTRSPAASPGGVDPDAAPGSPTEPGSSRATPKPEVPDRAAAAAALRGLADRATPERVRQCATNAAKHDCDFLSPDPLVVDEMAACGIVRYDFPAMFAQRDWTPQFEGQWLDLVSAADEEHDAIVAVADAFRDDFYAELETLAGELGVGEFETDATLLDVVVEISLAVGDDRVAEASRLVARERAGQLESPPTLDGRPAAERFVRLFTSVGDRFEDALATRLGPARAHELHTAQDGWPGLRAQTGARCPD